MALLVCLGAAATAYSATQAKGAVAILALDWLLTVCGVCAAHAPVLAHASSTAVLRPSGRSNGVDSAWPVNAVRTPVWANPGIETG